MLGIGLVKTSCFTISTYAAELNYVLPLFIRTNLIHTSRDSACLEFSRPSDFLGRVIVSHNFVQYPSDEASASMITWNSFKVHRVNLGRGVRSTTLRAQPTLAAFIRKLWPAATSASAARAASTYA